MLDLVEGLPAEAADADEWVVGFRLLNASSEYTERISMHRNAVIIEVGEAMISGGANRMPAKASRKQIITALERQRQGVAGVQNRPRRTRTPAGI